MINGNRKRMKPFKNKKILILFLLFYNIFLILFLVNNGTNVDLKNNSPLTNTNETPKISSLYGYINLTNNEINNTRHYHNSIIPIKGKVYEVLPPNSGLPNYNVSIRVDGSLDTRYKDKTKADGSFQINYTIPYSFLLTRGYSIEVDVVDITIPPKDFEKRNHFMLFANATTSFQIISSDDPLIPKLVGENFNINGFLRSDDGAGVNPATINRYWYNNSYLWNLGTFSTTLQGSFSQSIQVPSTPSSHLTLKLNTSSVPPNLNYSECKVNINVFTNVSCIWNIDANAAEGDEITIAGQIVSSTDVNMKIRNRLITLYFGGVIAGTVLTDGNGFFSIDYTVPSGTGVQLIEVEVDNTGGRTLTSTVVIDVEAAPVEEVPEVTPGETPAPFSNFLLPFIIIVAGVVTALLIYARYYYRKQEVESRVVAIPLEDKIVNLKILKDSGRLEEAVSYLFNAIFMTLVNAKFNRKKTVNETVRDFAIVTVRDLKMTPTIVYPFMSKVEEIIYNRPLRINDKDFYDAVNLFSPVYNELTGFHFTLNF